jgi:hypothetical protein
MFQQFKDAFLWNREGLAIEQEVKRGHWELADHRNESILNVLTVSRDSQLVRSHQMPGIIYQVAIGAHSYLDIPRNLCESELDSNGSR